MIAREHGTEAVIVDALGTKVRGMTADLLHRYLSTKYTMVYATKHS